MIDLGNIFLFNHEQIINKFDLILSNYDKDPHNHVKTITLRSTDFAHKKREVSYIAYLINNRGAFAKP